MPKRKTLVTSQPIPISYEKEAPLVVKAAQPEPVVFVQTPYIAPVPPVQPVAAQNTARLPQSVPLSLPTPFTAPSGATAAKTGAVVPFANYANTERAYWKSYDSKDSVSSFSTLFVSSLQTDYISSVQGDISTVFTSLLDLDGQVLTATSTELLLNGIPIATTQNISSLQDWALDPAVSTIQADGNNLVDVATGYFQTISSSSAYIDLLTCSTLIAQQVYSVSSYISTVSSVVVVADAGYFSTISSGTGYIQTLSAMSLTTSSIVSLTQFTSSLIANSAGISSLVANTVEVSSFTVSTINNKEYISGSNWSQYPATQSVNMGTNYLSNCTGVYSVTDLTVGAIDDINLSASKITAIANMGADITSYGKIELTAKNGLMGVIDITADTGFLDNGGEVNITANGGVTPAGVAYGGEVNITATTGTYTSLALTSAINLSAAGINSYAGATSAIGSTAGYNYMHGDLGANITAGVPPLVPNDPLTVYLYGTNGVLVFSPMYVKGPIRPYSDLTNNPRDLYIESYDNFINKGYVQLRGVSTCTFEGGDTAILGVNRLQFSTVGGAVENVSSINGLPIQAYFNVSTFTDLYTSTLAVSSINGISIDAYFNVSTFTDLYTSTLAVSSINGYSVGEYLNTNIFSTLIADTAFISSAQISSMYTDYISSGVADVNYLTASSISTAVIYGANPDVFGVFGIPGLKIDAPNVFLSTPQVTHPGFFNGSTIGANLVQAPTLSTNLILCSTGTVLTNGLSAQVVDTQRIALNSSAFSTSTTAGTAGQPAGRLILGGTDLDMGQNDLWCQQVRVGAGNPSGSAQTEVILYSPDGLTTRGLGIGGQDRTLRVVSTINGGGGGYILDTTINPPTFSTISTTTNLGSFFPSTALSTIGWSTITTVPQYYCSAFSSTSQTVVGANTITPLTHDYTGINLGGFTVLGSTITVPVAGVYELTTSIQFDTSSGGTNMVDFWFKKNGTDLTDSASGASVTGQGETLGTVTLLDVAQAGDKYAIIIASGDANMAATDYPPTVSPYTRPRIPSIITNIKRLN